MIVGVTSQFSSPMEDSPMKKRSTAPNPTTNYAPRQEKPSDTPVNGKWHLVALKAYQLYEQRGREDGHDVEDWIKAEAIINGTTE